MIELRTIDVEVARNAIILEAKERRAKEAAERAKNKPKMKTKGILPLALSLAGGAASRKMFKR
jgi:hypothetical protein